MKKTMVVAALLCVCSSLQAATMTFQDGVDGYAGTDDTTLIQNIANGNYGGRNEILLGAMGAGQQRAGVIRFDVTSLAGQYQTIDSIKLQFTVCRTAADNTFDLKLLREGNANWVEGTSASGAVQPGTASWNYSENPTQWLGGMSGARLATDVYGSVGSMSLSTATTPIGTLVEITLDPSSLASNVDTLTEIMDMWTQNSGADNAGFQIYGGNGQWGVDSSESATVSERPTLVVEYTPTPEPATMVLLVAGGLAMVRRRRHAKA